MRKLLPLLLLLLAPLTRATNVQITGVLVDASGNAINGKACFTLAVNGIDTSLNVAVSNLPICYGLTNGTFPSFATLAPNDIIQPSNTYYATVVYDAASSPVFRANYYITSGIPFNIGLAIPTTITTSNISYVTPILPTSNNTWTGINTFSNLNGIFYVDSNKYANVQAAFNTCVAPGCIIDMRGNPNPNALMLGTFDPGALGVTVLLGPYTYTIGQWTVRSGLNVIGQGHAFTFINQTNPLLAPFILPSTGGLVANGVTLKGFNLSGATSNSTDGLSFVAANGGGLFYSEIEDVTVGAGGTFGRNQIRFDSIAGAGIANTTDQFISLKNVVAFRAANGPPALLITGGFTGQISVEASQFDGPGARSDTTAVCNITINDGGVIYLPYSIVFKNVTSQWAWGTGSAAICLGGVGGFTSQGGHFENDNGIIKEALGTGGHGNWGVAIRDSYIATSGVNSGNGFIASLDTSSQLDFDNNAYSPGTPDQIFIGAGVNNITSYANTNLSAGGFVPWNQISEEASCVMSSGACATINLTHTYNTGQMACTGNWNGTGTLTGILKMPITVSGGTGGVGTVTPTSTVGTDTANINIICRGTGK